MSLKKFNKYSVIKLTAIAMINFSATTVWADIQPRSASLNYSQKALSNAGNPASAALIVERKDSHVMIGGAVEIGAGLEYGNLDELFAKIDEISNSFKPPADGGTTLTAPPTPENPIEDNPWDDLLIKYPELADRLDALKDKVVNTAGLLALIASEGYGKAEATANASFVLNEDLYGGTLLMGMGLKGNAKVVGLFEEIDFNSDQALEALKTIPEFDETDPIQKLDLSGGVYLYYNPANHKVKLNIDNDSMLLVKSTKISQFSLAYSKKALESEAGALYWGVKPTYYRVGLTNVSARLGEITDSEAIFEDIKNANYVYKNGFDIDMGVTWAAKNYQLGATMTNVIEKTYLFPELDTQRLNSTKIIQKINYHSEFTMQRQVKLEAGIFTQQRDWSLHAELDANPVEDPMRDRYQWLTVTAGYAADSWWLPSARFGFSRNLAGTSLGYLNAGVTFMKFINLDVATTLDTVTLDGDKYRRGVNLRLGVQFAY